MSSDADFRMLSGRLFHSLFTTDLDNLVKYNHQPYNNLVWRNTTSNTMSSSHHPLFVNKWSTTELWSSNIGQHSLPRPAVFLGLGTTHDTSTVGLGATAGS